MAGIYIHIPYCKQKCHYCNFYSFASRQYRDQFADALIKELEYRQGYLEDETVGTIYFGGGTPSLLTGEEIEKIIGRIQTSFNVENEAEITLEANPDDLSESWVAALRNSTSVNRLSIGIQSFFPEDLHYLNRVHDDHQARRAIEAALKHQFTNLTIDLIYGIPTLTIENWLKNLEIFFSYDLPHLSSYSLTVETKTALNTLIRKGKMQAVNEEQSVEHFRILLDETARHDYIHYEISNFAREGHYSRHNSIYWLGGHYLGLGPSAHAFNGKSRQWNVSNMHQYINAQTVAQIVKEKEILTPEQQFNEYVMTSLRTSWGCDTEHIGNVFGSDRVSYLEESISDFVQEGKVVRRGSTYFLTDYGKLFADGIAGELFL
jgi:oxygen-independent coproporphyrinogen-3 oxidase